MLPRFSNTDATKLTGKPALYGFGAVVRDQLNGGLAIVAGTETFKFSFEKGVCVEVFSKEGKATTLPEITRFALSTAALMSAEISFDPLPFSSGSREGLHGLRLIIALTTSLPAETVTKAFSVLVDDSSIHADAKVKKGMEPLPLDPEERGLLTVVENSKIVSDIFESSFLAHERIRALLFAYWICGLMTFETADQLKRKAYEESLTPQDHAIRAEVHQFLEQSKKSNYYQWLGVHPNASSADIGKQTASILEKYSSPTLEHAFEDERREEIKNLLAALEEAISVLGHPDKRAEYDEFLARGETGSISGQSTVVRVEVTMGEAEAFISAGKVKEGLSVYEKALGGAAVPLRLITAYSRALLRTGGPTSTENRDKAFAQLKRGLSLASDEPDLYLAIGEWCEAIRQLDKAFEANHRALLLNPLLTKAREALTRIKPEKAPKAILSSIYKNLSKINYYALLGVEKSASRDQIHKAYRNLSRQFHPDRFFQDQDPELPVLAKETYKRIVEAFMVLKDAGRRKSYDETLLQAPKSAKADGRPTAAPRHTGPTTRQGKRFYDLAVAALRDKKVDSAKLNLKLALQAEPNNTAIRKKLDEISRQGG